MMDFKRIHFCFSLLPLMRSCNGYATQLNNIDMKPKSTDYLRFHDRTNIGTLKVPTAGIGTIAWSSENDKELEEVVAIASKSNAAFFDTAERYGSNAKTALGMGYGETEKMTRKLLDRAMETQGRPTLQPVVATKFTPLPWRRTVESVVSACEQSIRNLGVEQIDLYQIHMPDVVQPFRVVGKSDQKDEMYWDGLAECYNRGLVKNVGVCNYGPTLVTECQEALAKRGVPLASNQIAYSLLSRKNGSQDTVDRCNELGVKVLACYPFAMGVLTGKYSSSSGSVVTSSKSRLETRDLERYARGDGKIIPKGGISPLLHAMEEIAQRRQKTVAQIALNYIITKGAVPIPGARTSSQVLDNIGAMGWRLSKTEIALLENEADRLGFSFDGAGFKRTNEKFVGYGVEKFSLE